MKLWQKASLVFIATLLLVMASCSSIMLLYMRNSVLSLAHENIRSKEGFLYTSFATMADLIISDVDSEVTKSSLLIHSFSILSDSRSVLVKDNEILYSFLNIDPTKYLLPSDEQQLYEGVVESRNILIAGGRIIIQNDAYYVYIVEDITSTYQEISKMTYVFALISLFGVVIGAGIIVFMIRLGEKPLVALCELSGRIAEGEYDIRISINSADEFGALARGFNAMAEAVQIRVAQLEESNERQRLFIGGVAHEFRTPLTAAILHTQMLQHAAITEEQKVVSLACIEKQCKWLEGMRQSLLNIILLKQKVEKKPVSSRELLDRVRDSTELLLEERGVTLVLSGNDSTLLVDIDLMQSLLVNLVDNASKAYDEGSLLHEVWLSAKDNILEVRDEGCGIPEDDISRIFEPFYMVDKSRSKKYGSSGLGLALVKEIADAHDALLEVKSEVRKGTVIRVITK